MAIKVFDFYTKEKLNVNKKHNLLLSNALFYVLLEVNGKNKELSVQVPKKFHYERFYEYKDFTFNKVVEFSILSDYIKWNQDLMKSKWGLTEEDYYELITQLEYAFLHNYFVKGELFKWPLLLGVWVEDMLDRFIRRFS